MHNITVPSSQVIEEFRRELWKDQRILKVIETGGEQRFVKTFDHQRDAYTEGVALKLIYNELGEGYVPHVYKEESLSITMDYLKGIRVFNFFVELDNLAAMGNDSASDVKSYLMKRCIDRQKKIQQVLYRNTSNLADQIYPVSEKIKSIIRILSEPLSLRVNWKILDKELDTLGKYWGSVSKVPFRDATIKNMVICDSNLWMGNFSSEEERRKKIEYGLKNDSAQWKLSPIMDFDFTSVCDLTTPEDDPISIMLHERTWQGPIFNPEDLIWIEGEMEDPYRAAVTLITRYFRFGGRKLGYRLIHPRAHCTRFRYDHGEFYFQRLAPLVEKWSKDAANDFKGILKFSSIIDSVITDRLPAVDFFLSKYSGTRREYYLDMYPD